MRSLLIKVAISCASVIIMAMAAALIVVVHIAKFLKRIIFRDPFHDSRRHPLNSPEAPRG
ncbi:MAG: hypothetical protein A3D87_08900 [Omnitrophica WOR_2 bacterium RIFCSPHIGHO2_02_FULL_50_17]|nr:MAG: hypothetical protein A3D87_08900 [Omnitrophica WOR_2 bacterium RIFCSPHIGHO2_02_FULL_50_17]